MSLKHTAALSKSLTPVTMLLAGSRQAARAASLRVGRRGAAVAACVRDVCCTSRLNARLLVPHRRLSVQPCQRRAQHAFATSGAQSTRRIDGHTRVSARAEGIGMRRVTVGATRTQVATIATCSTARWQADGRSIESTYQKMSPIEHVLLRPGMYVGGTKEVATDAWCFRAKGQDGETHPHMMHARVRTIPGLLKVRTTTALPMRLQVAAGASRATGVSPALPAVVRRDPCERSGPQAARQERVSDRGHHHSRHSVDAACDLRVQ